MAFLHTTLFSICLSGAALPVFAQTTPPAAEPAAPQATPPDLMPAPGPTSDANPVPDTGIKHTAPAIHVHHRTHHHAQAAKAPAPTTQSGT